jgi:RNA polymerase sigma factor (TIGR02999 family)
VAGLVTQLLIGVRAGDRAALDRVFTLVYEELHARAHRQLAQSYGARTLSTTALVHETFLKLSAADRPAWEDRRHFFGVAARAMRQIIVDQARRRLAHKRGGHAQRLDIADVDVPIEERAEELLALDAAVEKLERENPRLAEVVNLRFYAGLSVEDAARTIDTSERTVKRDWRLARAYLYGELSRNDELPASESDLEAAP